MKFNAVNEANQIINNCIKDNTTDITVEKYDAQEYIFMLENECDMYLERIDMQECIIEELTKKLQKKEKKWSLWNKKKKKDWKK